ncbi:hypothetical protein ACJX0J_006948, partial [Zea mays]
GDARPFVEEDVLQVSDWGFNLSDIQMQKKEAQRLFELIKSLFNQAKREWVGFLGPIHIWQKMFSFRLRTHICRDKKDYNIWFAYNVFKIFYFGDAGDITPPTRIRQAMEMQAEVERRKCAQIMPSFLQFFSWAHKEVTSLSVIVLLKILQRAQIHLALHHFESNLHTLHLWKRMNLGLFVLQISMDMLASSEVMATESLIAITDSFDVVLTYYITDILQFEAPNLERGGSAG